jgi:LysM repeat protein
MFEVSQLYGIKLAKLYYYNRMEDNQQPAAGESLNLKRRRSSSDLVILRDAKDVKPRPQQGKLQPTDDELFEIGPDKKVKTNNTPPPTVTTPPGKPATTGVPYPNDPVPAAPVITPGANTPPPGALVPPPSQPQQPAGGGNFIYHTVVKGDTLFNISRRYNITVEKIRQLNNLPDNSIRIGQNLKIQVQ